MPCREKFVADAMLGKLTRWLRILGCDTLGPKELGEADEAFLEGAARRQRVLLTADDSLFKLSWKRGAKAHYVRSGSVAKRLAELSRLYGVPLRIAPTASLCPECNSRLIEVPSDQAPVPEGITKRHPFVFVCSNCGKAFWLGSHYLNMLRTLVRAKLIRDQGIEL